MGKKRTGDDGDAYVDLFLPADDSLVAGGWTNDADTDAGVLNPSLEPVQPVSRNPYRDRQTSFARRTQPRRTSKKQQSL